MQMRGEYGAASHLFKKTPSDAYHINYLLCVSLAPTVCLCLENPPFQGLTASSAT
jgi:hypothetical protein